MRLFKKTNIDFMGKRTIWYSISVATLVLAVVALVFKGVTLGIDFLGGTEILVRFQSPVAITDVMDMASNGLCSSTARNVPRPSKGSPGSPA